MTDNVDKQGRHPISVGQVFSLIEKASEPQWAMIMLSFFLFADSALVIYSNVNIWHWPWIKNGFAAILIPLIFIVTAFSVTMACILPVIEAILVPICNSIYHRLTFLWINAPHFTRHRGMVTVSELKKQADLEQSDYLIAKIHDHKEKVDNATKERIQLASISFKTGVFLTFNLFILGTPTSATSSQLFMASLSPTATTLTMCGVYIYLIALCFRSWLQVYETGWIHYEPLYEEIRKREDQLKKEHFEHA